MAFALETKHSTTLLVYTRAEFHPSRTNLCKPGEKLFFLTNELPGPPFTSFARVTEQLNHTNSVIGDAMPLGFGSTSGLHKESF